jgi:hypothetical protein
MIRACDDCGQAFAPTYPDQWECDSCDERRARECFARLEEIEHGRAVMQNAGDSLTQQAGDEHEAFFESLRCPECERSNGPHYAGPCEHGEEAA